MYEDKENGGETAAARGKRVASGTAARAPVAVR